MGAISHLEPKLVMHWFEVIASIPHGSLKEEKLSARIMEFAREKGLECVEDEYHNVLVRKPATPGYEGKDPVILQAHIDMVWAKEKDLDFDFETQGLNLAIDGDHIHASGTTLGADDGIGAAYMLAVLDSDDIAHPPIEAVFTTAEEIGLVGASHFDMSQLKGTRMINFDAGGFTEGRIYVGAGGGMKAEMTHPAEFVPYEGSGQVVAITIDGLHGGHAGGDIGKGRGNSSVLMGRLMSLITAEGNAQIASYFSGDSGNPDNKYGIPAEATVVAYVEDLDKLNEQIKSFEANLKSELSDVDDGVKVHFESATAEKSVLNAKSVEKTCDILALLPNGVQTMQRLFPDTPECSANVGKVSIENGVATYCLGIRCSKDSLSDFMAAKYLTIAKLTGCEVSFGLRMPGWDYSKESAIREVVDRQYKAQFGQPPRFKVTHAGTECSMFKLANPSLDIISMGPIIYEEHTPKEWMGIWSIGVLWDFLKNVLRQL